MKTANVIPHFLVASALLVGSSCSTSNTGSSSGTTSGSSMATSSSMDATSGSSVAGSSAAETGNGATGTGIVGAGSDTGMGTAGTSSASTSGTADLNAFMATFATMQDPVFLMTAASSNLLEIQMGKLATQKSTNADVKKFGQMMVTHHTKATQELKTVATPLGVTLPETMMPVHQAMADKLLAKSGKEFDEEYMDAMEMAHKMDVAMFEVKSGAAENPAVKSFATKTLPMLRSHQTMANEVEKKVD